MQFLKSLLSLVVMATLIYVGVTVPLGERTLFGHLRAIWGSDEARDLIDGVKETGAPVIDKLGRAVQAGVDEASKPAPTAEESPLASPPAEPSPLSSAEPGAASPQPQVTEPAEPAAPAAPVDVGPKVANQERGGVARFELRPKIDIHVAP